jgi:hypothetical protein
MNVFIQMTAQKLSKVFQKHMCWHCPAVLLYPRAGSLDEVWMLLHHTPRLKRIQGLLSMSSCIMCPCFWITASVSQLASSTGWFFHFTRYSKYCFLLVLFPSRFSSMHSICGFCATGNCFCHWITGSSVPVSASLAPYGYKSETLKIRRYPDALWQLKLACIFPEFL